jgi:hypothetical protein
MAAVKRIYVIDGKNLVRATNASQALRHVVANTHTVAVATPEVCIKLTSDGVKVEDASTEGV